MNCAGAGVTDQAVSRPPIWAEAPHYPLANSHTRRGPDPIISTALASTHSNQVLNSLHHLSCDLLLPPPQLPPLLVYLFYHYAVPTLRRHHPGEKATLHSNSSPPPLENLFTATMLKKGVQKVPDAWDDADWETQADVAAKEAPKEKPGPAVALDKHERMALHRESNRKLWQSAYATTSPGLPPPVSPLTSSSPLSTFLLATAITSTFSTK